MPFWWTLLWVIISFGIIFNVYLFLAPYFVDCINEQDLDEMNVEIIRNTLYKAYLEDFYKFCKNLGGKTAEVMCEILSVRP
jgi:vacuolar-type H+-ATPase subunit C/Vma6